MSSPRFAALRIRDYRRYFLLGLLSQTADNIEHVISYWVIFQKFHSPTLAGFAVISHWVPFLLFSFYMGALADRYDCRKLIQISQGMFMLASAAWGAALPHRHAASVARGGHPARARSGRRLLGPASQLILHDMVGGTDLPSAIRINASSRNLAILLGPAIGGGMMLLLGPAWGLLANVVLYWPFTLFLARVPYTGHGRPGQTPRRAGGLGLGDSLRLLRQVSAERRIVMMIALGGVTSFFVGNAFQAQMPEYAHDFGADEAGGWYSMLLAGNAAGAILGAILLETLDVLRPSARAAMVCAGLWGVTIGLFALTRNYVVAVSLLVLAGAFNIAFTSMAQTLVQLLAPAAPARPAWLVCSTLPRSVCARAAA